MPDGKSPVDTPFLFEMTRRQTSTPNPNADGKHPPVLAFQSPPLSEDGTDAVSPGEEWLLERTLFDDGDVTLPDL